MIETPDVDLNAGLPVRSTQPSGQATAVHAQLARLAAEFATSDRAEASEPLAPARASFESTRALPGQSGSDELGNDFAQDIDRIIDPKTTAERCLSPLLMSLGWAGALRHVREALPHFDRVVGIEALRSVLARLGFASENGRLDASIEAEMLPSVTETADGDILVCVERDKSGKILAFSGAHRCWQYLPPGQLGGSHFFFRNTAPGNFELLDDQRSWLWSIILRFKPLILAIVLLSLLINAAALCVPFFILHVYDLGIGTRSGEVVLSLAAGAGIILSTDCALRYVRARALAYFGSRVDALIGIAAFQQLIRIPIAMVESAQIGSQISRLRQFESIRDAFTGPLAAAIIDIPFVFIFLAAVAYYGGNLVWIPLCLVLIFTTLSVVLLPLMKASSADLGGVRQRLMLLTRELLDKRQIIRDNNAEEVWVLRHRRLMDDWIRRNARIQFLNNFAQTIAQSLVSLSGVATLALGTIWVMAGSMTLGALLGTMALVWRVLSPLQTIFLSMSRLDQALQTIHQINRLMAIPAEREPATARVLPRRFLGEIVANRLVFRYPQRTEPALRGMMLQIKAGECIAVTGPSGSGKTTLLKLILGLYPPLAGAVLVDGLDLRQTSTSEWRLAVSFLPEQNQFFYGTIAQNLRLSRPDATDRDIAKALTSAGVNLCDPALPEGIETRLTAHRLEKLSEPLKQSIALARCFIKPASVYLLDNPGANSDVSGAEAMMKAIERLKGKSTVIFTTFRPAYMRLADRVLVMNEGQIVGEGAPEKVIERLAAAV